MKKEIRDFFEGLNIEGPKRTIYELAVERYDGHGDRSKYFTSKAGIIRHLTKSGKTLTDRFGSIKDLDKLKEKIRHGFELKTHFAGCNMVGYYQPPKDTFYKVYEHDLYE